MPLTVTCPGCQTPLQVADALLGQAIKCPRCQLVLKIGAPAATKQPETQPERKPEPQPEKKPEPQPERKPQPQAQKKPSPQPQKKPVEQAEKKPQKKPPPLPALEIPDDKPAPRAPAQKKKEKPKELDEILDESSLETVEVDEVLDESQLETVEDSAEDAFDFGNLTGPAKDEPAPKKAGKKSRRDDAEEDDRPRRGESRGRKKQLNTNEHGDPLEELGLSKKQRREVEEELGKNEHVVWAGTTSDGVAAYNARIAQIVGFVFLGIGVVLAIGGFLLYSSGALPMLGLAAVLVFVVVWCGIATLAIFAPSFYGRKREGGAQASRHLSDLFVLTNRRCLCWMSRFPGRLFSYNALQVRDMQRKDHRSVPGAGSLVFDTEEEVHTTGGRHARASIEVVDLGFIGIDDVREVERLVRRTLLREDV